MKEGFYFLVAVFLQKEKCSIQILKFCQIVLVYQGIKVYLGFFQCECNQQMHKLENYFPCIFSEYALVLPQPFDSAPGVRANLKKTTT